jgi:hypothetical protein
MPSRFVPDPSFQLTVDYLVQKGAEPVAESARSIAHRIMPRGRGEQIVVETSGGKVRVVNKARGWHLDEYGSKNNPVYSPLRRGARRAGLRFLEE